MASLLLPCVATGVPLSAIGCLFGATPRGQPWPSAVPFPPGRNGLSARRMAGLSTFRTLSLCRHVHHKLLRSAVLDVTPKIPATACHQRNYVERYSRFTVSLSVSPSSWVQRVQQSKQPLQLVKAEDRVP
jgi:hypothetical protein